MHTLKTRSTSFFKMGLFGRKKAEAQENPYAQQQAQEEYDRMTPYQRARADVAGNGPRPNIPGGLPSGPGPRQNYTASPAPSSQGYGKPPQGYGSDRYGSGNGYGTNRYEHNSSAFSINQSVPPARSGGYGGLGGRPEDEPNRDELLGGGDSRTDSGSNRYGPKVPQPGDIPNRYAAAGPQSNYDEENNYEDLTPEQQEEKEYRKLKLAQKQERGIGIDSTQRTLAMLNQAEETGMRTLANLGSQGERLNKVEQNLNMSSVHARNAEAKTKELKTLNRSMFAIHMENPLTKKKRLAAQEQAIIDQSQADRQDREVVRGAGYRDQQAMENFFNQMEEQRAKSSQMRSDSKYNFDDSDDEEDREDEMTLERNQREIGQGLGRLKMIASEQGNVIRRQNDVIDRIGNKTDGVTDHVIKNSAKLKTFK